MLINRNVAVGWGFGRLFNHFVEKSPRHEQVVLQDRAQAVKYSASASEGRHNFRDFLHVFKCVTAGKYASGKDEQLLAKKEAALKKAKPKQRIGSTLKRLGSIVRASLGFLFCELLKQFLLLTDKYCSSLGPGFQVYFHAELTPLILKASTPVSILILTANASKTMNPSLMERVMNPLLPKATKVLYFFKALSTTSLYL